LAKRLFFAFGYHFLRESQKARAANELDQHTPTYAGRSRSWQPVFGALTFPAHKNELLQAT
jgi:hypothetical protein